MGSVQGLTATGVPPMPKWLLFLRIGIIVLSLGVLIAAAYNISVSSGGYYYYGLTSGPAGFLIFDAIFTWLILGFMIASELFFPRLYYRLAFIVFLGLAIIFWLSAWAWAARWASFYGEYGRYADIYGSITAAALFGALVWVALIVVTVFFVRASLADSEGTVSASTSTPVDTELGQSIKPEVQAQVHAQDPYAQPQAYPPQQAPYPPQQQQPYPPQQQAQYPPPQ